MARRSNLSLAKQIGGDIKRSLASQLQGAAVEITNGLAQAGPAWSGRFSSAWDVVPAGRAGSPPRSEGRVYKYDKRNFPLSRFEKELDRKNPRFEVVNSSEYAEAALDFRESVFTRAGKGEPVKPIVEEGGPRPSSGDGQDEHLRWQLGSPDEEITSGITAEKDWYPDYVRGGRLQRDLRVGASRASISPGRGFGV